MEAPGYGEEEEPINTILGKVWCVSIYCRITTDGSEWASSTNEDFKVVLPQVNLELFQNKFQSSKIWDLKVSNCKLHTSA